MMATILPATNSSSMAMTSSSNSVMVEERNEQDDDKSLSSLSTSTAGNNNNNSIIKPPQKMSGIVYPNIHDVLLGRGGYTASHPGNIRYRALLDEYRDQYQACKNKQDKLAIIAVIIQKWRLQDPPGRFVIMTNPGQVDSVWHDVGDEVMTKKCQQTLRQRRAQSQQLPPSTCAELFGQSQQQPSMSVMTGINTAMNVMAGGAGGVPSTSSPSILVTSTAPAGKTAATVGNNGSTNLMESIPERQPQQLSSSAIPPPNKRPKHNRGHTRSQSMPAAVFTNVGSSSSPLLLDGNYMTTADNKDSHHINQGYVNAHDTMNATATANDTVGDSLLQSFRQTPPGQSSQEGMPPLPPTSMPVGHGTISRIGMHQRARSLAAVPNVVSNGSISRHQRTSSLGKRNQEMMVMPTETTMVQQGSCNDSHNNIHDIVTGEVFDPDSNKTTSGEPTFLHKPPHHPRTVSDGQENNIANTDDYADHQHSHGHPSSYFHSSPPVTFQSQETIHEMFQPPPPTGHNITDFSNTGCNTNNNANCNTYNNTNCNTNTNYQNSTNINLYNNNNNNKYTNDASPHNIMSQVTPPNFNNMNVNHNNQRQNQVFLQNMAGNTCTMPATTTPIAANVNINVHAHWTNSNPTANSGYPPTAASNNNNNIYRPTNVMNNMNSGVYQPTNIINHNPNQPAVHQPSVNVQQQVVVHVIDPSPATSSVEDSVVTGNHDEDIAKFLQEWTDPEPTQGNANSDDAASAANNSLMDMELDDMFLSGDANETDEFLVRLMDHESST